MKYNLTEGITILQVIPTPIANSLTGTYKISLKSVSWPWILIT